MVDIYSFIACLVRVGYPFAAGHHAIILDMRLLV
jgi:hypothetical protein